MMRKQTQKIQKMKNGHILLFILLVFSLLLCYSNLYSQKAYGAERPASELKSSEQNETKKSSKAAKVAVTTIYVDQTNGNDGNAGTAEAPVETMDGAAKKLLTSDAGGSIDTNVVSIVGEYRLGSSELFSNAVTPVPVTITGGTIIGHKMADDYALFLEESFQLKSLEVQQINHIYGQGHNITIGADVKNSSSAFYLYGAGRDSIVGNVVGEISVYSGKVTRIVGYVRSIATTLEANNLEAKITIGGTASVDNIVAGLASGGVNNAKVRINVEGGQVDNLIGGNQGFNKNKSPFTGDTEINISGGTVTSVYGAGSGRNSSIPTYTGDLKIKVSGGTVTSIYGAGTAAFVTSNADKTSKVDISVTGNGTVKDIFAAGKGGGGVDDKADAALDFTQESANFGSLTGTANITVDGNAVVTGSIYASGEGLDRIVNYDTKANAYLNGTAAIKVAGNSTIKGSIYGGGKGSSKSGYERCARVTKGSQVKVQIESGTVEGNVYGGGETANVESNTSVTLSGGTINGNLYGGGKDGAVEGTANVNIQNGTVNGSVYGGALGTVGNILVNGKITVNMTNGWIRGNLYGGSEQSDDGPAGSTEDLIFVNFVGGTVSGNVFGGGYRGIVNGSTHLHIGMDSLEACAYYSSHKAEMPQLTLSSPLLVGGSAYAGGDYGGGDNIDYDVITVKGTSHVYIDGNGYNTKTEAGEHSMSIAGGVFGSGASCDAGSTRLVTLKNYGTKTENNGVANGATRSLTAIQRADRVLLINSHIKLTGASDIANENQTALYSLNRIGDHGDPGGKLGALGNGLVLQSGSTLVLESEAIELANFKSVGTDGSDIDLSGIAANPNTLLLNTGTILRVSYTPKSGDQTYGAVSGYTYLLAGENAEAYVYARMGTDSDGGFVDKDAAVISFTEVAAAAPQYRYWKVSKAGSKAVRNTVLTAQKLKSGDAGYNADGYSVAKGIIELPPAEKGSTYTIKSITIPGGTGLTLVEAAKNKQDNGATWVTSEKNASSGSGVSVNLADEQKKIKDSPMDNFGLFMRIGNGFAGADTASGKIVSNNSANSGHSNTIINQSTASSVNSDHITPQIEFYLTYGNDITRSQELGTVQIELVRTVNGSEQETTVMNVELVSKATELSDQELTLYATQAGSFEGRLLIPAGSSRKLALTGVEASSGSDFVAASKELEGEEFSITMLPENSQSWQTSGLRTEVYDLKSYEAGNEVQIGTTDSRYQAAIVFTMKNCSSFNAKADDTVQLTLTDLSSSPKETFTVKLAVKWKASVVSKIESETGRQYNTLKNADKLVIGQEGSITSAFTLHEESNPVSDLWIELQNQGKNTQLPAGTKITLLRPDTNPYYYIASGNEMDGKIQLTQFRPMWGSTPLSGNLGKETLTMIVDFGSAESKLGVGNYSLRLRNSTGADSMGAAFTINNGVASLNFEGQDGLSRDKYSLTLKVQTGSDTRFTNGTAAVLSTEDAEGFPDGIVFHYGGKNYYPSNGKVYLPLSSAAEHNIEMDTTDSAGLAIGAKKLKAELFSTGYSTGQTASIKTADFTYQVKQNPSYGLKVEEKNKVRNAKPAADLVFTAKYSVKNSEGSSKKITVDIKKKNSDKSYESAEGWGISGNENISQESGSQEIKVKVPADISPGTYRLLFKLGDKETPYNVIIPDPA